jgi:hypothetical protein
LVPNIHGKIKEHSKLVTYHVTNENDNYALYSKEEAIKDETVVGYVFTTKLNALLIWKSVYCPMVTGEIYIVSCDCASLFIDTLLKEVDTAKIYFYMSADLFKLSKEGP